MDQIQPARLPGAVPTEVIPAWAKQYVGLEFEDGGRGPKYDCWGLMRLVYAEQFNVDLPSFIGEYEDVHDKVSIAEIYEGYHRYWRAISASEARLGDAVVMRLKGLPIHFGIMLAPGRFLHVLEGLNSVIEKTKAPLWKDRIVGYWRHEGMQ